MKKWTWNSDCCSRASASVGIPVDEWAKFSGNNMENCEKLAILLYAFDCCLKSRVNAVCAQVNNPNRYKVCEHPLCQQSLCFDNPSLPNSWYRCTSRTFLR